MNKPIRPSKQADLHTAGKLATRKRFSILYNSLNKKNFSGLTMVATGLLITACSGGNNESIATQATLDDETIDNISICANRLGRSSDDLLQEIAELTGKLTFTVATNATDIDAGNKTWDNTVADVICTEETNDVYSYNLIRTVNEGQVVYGSQSTEYIGSIEGGTVFGFGGQDFVANLKSGAFYGGDGEDLIDSPVEHGLYTGWAYVPVVSDGMSGGEFYGEDGDDYVAQLNGGDFYGEADQDHVASMSGGRFFGGPGSDSITDPYHGKSGEMSGGEFHGGSDNDSADNVSGGTVFGDTGDDLVQQLSGAEFNGMQGNDTVYSLNEGAVFNGGPDDDLVDSMTGGTFDGGEGTDSLNNYYDGNLIDVE